MNVQSILKRNRWSPYVVGAAIGVLSWVTFVAMGKALGTSTTMAKAAGLATAAVVPEHVEANAYYGKYFNPPKKMMFDWQFFLVLALPVGAFLASRLSGKGFRERVPKLWETRFGPGRAKRYVAAFLGGAILLFGARLAGGCTSGHGISGGLQLAVSSWTFTFAMFASGIATAFALFGTEGGRHV